MISRRMFSLSTISLLASSKKLFAQSPGQDLHNGPAYTRQRLALSTCELIVNGGSGTGFFFRFSDVLSSKALFGIITNKHVAKAGASMALRHSSIGASPIVLLPDFHKFLIEHPDPDVDLCVSFCCGNLNGTPYEGNLVAYSYDDIPTKEILSRYDDASRILIVGYPKGIIDESHGEPLFRSGILSTPPDKCFSGTRQFLVDASIWGGSSGSPVVLYDNPVNTMGSIRPYLIGIVRATEVQAIELASKNGQEPTLDPDHASPNNLGVCVASDTIVDLAEAALQQMPLLQSFGLSAPKIPRFQL